MYCLYVWAVLHIGYEAMSRRNLFLHLAYIRELDVNPAARLWLWTSGQ